MGNDIADLCATICVFLTLPTKSEDQCLVGQWAREQGAHQALWGLGSPAGLHSLFQLDPRPLLLLHLLPAMHTFPSPFFKAQLTVSCVFHEASQICPFPPLLPHSLLNLFYLISCFSGSVVIHSFIHLILRTFSV